MSTAIIPITLRDVAWQHLSDDIIIGKDILELLSSSMYVDPMTIFREYVQNAADSVDEARAEGILKPAESGSVWIVIDGPARNVKITDNGTGIPYSDFAKRLTAFGASKKRGGGTRGFRGVGRLAGMGYRQELIFRSRIAGEAKISELRWDCRKLKAILRNSEGPNDLRDAVGQVVELRRIAAGDAPERFFEVEMRGIIRHRNDQLLSTTAINSYLAQVAPVPFHEDFPFKDEILAHLGSNVRLGNLHISIGESEIPVSRPHRDALEVSVGAFDPFTGVELLQIEGLEGETACLGWVLHHGYTGALPKIAPFQFVPFAAWRLKRLGRPVTPMAFTTPLDQLQTVGKGHSSRNCPLNFGGINARFQLPLIFDFSRRCADIPVQLVR